MTSRVVMGMSTNNTLPERKHKVAAVHFEHNAPADAARVSCECGWNSTVAEWGEHAPRTSVSYAWSDAGYRRTGATRMATP